MRAALLTGGCLIGVAALVFLLRTCESAPPPEGAANTREDVVPGGAAKVELPLPAATRSASEERAPQPHHRVSDSDGVGILAATVRWIALEREDLDAEPAWRGDDWGPLVRRTRVSTTDADGFFDLGELPEAEHGALLWAWKLGYAAQGLVLAPGARDAVDSWNLVLEPATPVRVRVFDALGDPAGGAVVAQHGTTPRRIEDPGALSLDRFRRLLSIESPTDAEGLALLPPIPGVSVFLAARGDARSAPWRGEDPGPVRLVLRDGFTVAGTLSLPPGDGGLGESELRIRFVSLEGAVERTLATLRGVRDGHFGPVTLPRVPRSRYSALLEGAPLVPQFHEFADPGVGGHVEVRFDATRGVELALVAVEANGDVILDAEAEVYWPVGERKAWLRCSAGEDGVLRARGVPPGSVRYRVGAPGFATFYGEFGTEVPLDSPTPIRVRLDPAGTLRGVVLHDGEPVPDFKLWAWRRDATSEVLYRSFTDQVDGIFTWTELPVGEAMITATGAETSTNEPALVQVTAEGNDLLVIELPGVFERTGTLLSGVTGGPIAGAVLEVFRVVGPNGPISAQGRPTTTANDGSFRIEGLGPGANWLVAQASGYATDEFGVEVDEGRPEDVGELFLWTEQSFVVELSGPPGFDPRDYHAVIDTGAQDQAFDADGRVRFEGVWPGLVTVVIRRPQGGWFSVRAEVTPGRDTIVRHDLGAGGRLHIEVEPREGYDASAGFSAYVYSFDPRGVAVSTGLALNPTGITTLEGVETDGEVLVKVLRKGDWVVVGSAHGSFHGADELHLRIPAGGDVLAVRALDPDGAPLEGVDVVFGREGPPVLAIEARTDGEGWARLFVPEEAGTLRLHHERFGAAEQVPWAGGPGTLEVRLAGDASLRLLVRDEEGPVASAIVRTKWLSGYRWGDVHRTDASGHVHLDGLGAGPVRVHVEHARHWSAEFQLEARMDAPLAEVRLPELSRLELRLVGAEGEPVRGVSFALRSIDLGESVASWLSTGRVLGSLVTDENGSVALDRLPSGTYAWSAPGSSGGTVSVRGGETSRFVLRRDG